jgi:hypothetical protein
MGHFKDTTVEVKFGGKTVRVSPSVADALKKAGRLDKKKVKAKEKNPKLEK